jgi:hypothetical protein
VLLEISNLPRIRLFIEVCFQIFAVETSADFAAGKLITIYSTEPLPRIISCGGTHFALRAVIFFLVTGHQLNYLRGSIK